MLGAIEAGGTKFVCAVADMQGQVVDRVRIDTEAPEITMTKVFEFFDQYKLQSIGIACFGPINVDIHSDTFGQIGKSAKVLWRDFDFLGSVLNRYPGIAYYWTTDVNGSAYGEYQAGAAKNVDSCLYLTIGTGVGGGAVLKGNILENIRHPEMGHMRVIKHPKDLDFAGNCPVHQDCLEGMAAGPSIVARYGVSGAELAEDHEIWEIISDYIAQALVTYTYIIAPDKIIIGGGVAKQEQMLPMIREKFKQYNQDYLPIDDLEEYIVTPGLGDDAALVGCIELAKKALNNSDQ